MFTEEKSGKEHKEKKNAYNLSKVIVTNSIPIAVPNMGCGEGGDFIPWNTAQLWNTLTVRQLSQSKRPRPGDFRWSSAGETAQVLQLKCCSSSPKQSDFDANWEHTLVETGETDLANEYRPFPLLLPEWFTSMQMRTSIWVKVQIALSWVVRMEPLFHWLMQII